MVTAAPPSKVAGSPRSDDDKAGTPLAGLSCSCWVLHKPIEKSSAWGQKTPYYNRPTQDGLRGHFVLRAIGKRFRKDRTAGARKSSASGSHWTLRWRELDSNLRSLSRKRGSRTGRLETEGRLLTLNRSCETEYQLGRAEA